MASALDAYLMQPDDQSPLTLDQLMGVADPNGTSGLVPTEVSLEQSFPPSADFASQVPATSGQHAADLTAQYDQKLKEAALQEQQGIGQLEQYINDYQKKPRGVDFTALASLFPGNPQLMDAAKATKPETEAEKQANILGLQQKLLASKHQATQGQIQGLSAALRAQMQAQIAAQRGQQFDQSMKLREKLGLAGLGNKKDNIDLRNDFRDRMEHQNTLRLLSSNKNVKDRLTQYQNLDNSLALVTNADTLTPQQIQEFQQSIRGNLGIKGTGGVEERGLTYFRSLGLNAAAWKQFLTGDPVALAKDSHLMEHLKNLASVEKNNIQSQYTRSIDAATRGHKSMYDRRPDLKGDLVDATRGFSGLVEDQPAPGGQQPPPAPGGGTAPVPSFEEWKKMKGHQ